MFLIKRPRGHNLNIIRYADDTGLEEETEKKTWKLLQKPVMERAEKGINIDCKKNEYMS